MEFNTFQKHSSDSKLSTNTYLMSVGAVFKKLYFKVNVSLVSIETKPHGPRFNIVPSSTLFTFGYPNLTLSMLQYISFYFNIDIATFDCFQIAIYAYVVHLCCVLLHTQA